MFLLCFFLFSLFIIPCFFFVYLNLTFSLNLIHFYLIYYQESIIKLSILHTIEIAWFFRKKTRNKIADLLFLATKRLCSLLITGRHYSLLVIQISSRSKFLEGTHIFSRSLVNVNCSEEIYPALLKQQSIKRSTTKSCRKLYHDLQSARNSAN